MLQDEYAGSCLCDDKREKFILSLNLERYMNGEVKLPIPNLNVGYKKTSIPLIDINPKNKDGMLAFKPQFTRFARLMSKKNL
ncbi:hypothetical protein [Lysinibacillus capsici]|uniref:hypothetical protein n=1 Tax=Lysinibacillus capsici TaxID=2115968 RepID=UPI003D75E48F